MLKVQMRQADQKIDPNGWESCDNNNIDYSWVLKGFDGWEIDEVILRSGSTWTHYRKEE